MKEEINLTVLLLLIQGVLLFVIVVRTFNSQRRFNIKINKLKDELKHKRNEWEEFYKEIDKIKQK